MSKQRIETKRIYEAASKDDGLRILVDRVWPRGVSKEDAVIDYWAKDLAPSTELRKWFNHDPAKWDEFQQRYRKELAGKKAQLGELADKADSRTMTLLYGAKDTKHNQATVLKKILEGML